MSIYELVLEVDGEDVARFPVKDTGVTIGRSQDADIMLKGALVSRKHARLWYEKDLLMVEDLGSRNGISINKTKTLRGILKLGDTLTIGEHDLNIEELDSLPSTSTTLSYDSAVTICDSIMSEDTSKGRLPVLYKTAQLLGSIFDLDELLEKILKTIFEAIPAKRGYILTLDQVGTPTIRATMSKGSADKTPPLSTTVVQHVINERNAVLTTDAQDDKRFESSHSVLNFDIQSAMCVPLCGRDEVAGAIYVDSGASPEPFKKADLELLTAIGQVAGVAVENARLYQDRVQQERLAAIGQATAGVGHCIKNILTGISGGAQIVNMALKEDNMEYLEKGWPIMRRAIERIEELVLNTLSYSKERKPELIPTDINSIVRDVIETSQNRAKKHDINMEFDQGKLDVISVDVQEIFRVVLNLVANAMDACQKTSGTVRIATRQEADGCLIEVCDDGPGIPPEIMPTIFQAFVTTKGSSGTGLGLACCIKSVREHGGDITVESEPSKGASFTVFLPGSVSAES